MEEQIKMAKLNAEYKKKNNDLKARKQMVENIKHTRLQHVDDEYQEKKRGLLADIAELRKNRMGFAFEYPRRLNLSDDIRNVEDQLNILKDERDIEARRVAHEAFADLMELEEEGRRLDEWLGDEKIKVMEEQHAARLAKEAAEAEKGGEQ